MRRITCWLGIGLIVSCVAAVAQADVRLPKVYSDHAVLQRGLPLVVWGWADPGEKVTVTLGGQTQEAIAGTNGTNGTWRVQLSPLKTGSPLEMVVTGKNTIKVKDLLVGDVWLCSGQSNMQMKLAEADNAKETISRATNGQIRLLGVGNDKSEKPLDDINGTWSICSPRIVSHFSAVGYFFGKAIHDETGVPIGLIGTAYGGTPIEPWIRADVWTRTATLASLKVSPVLGHYYNGRIAPLVPYGIKGVIWYQGESNGGDGDIYIEKMRTLIGDWREVWGVYAGQKARNGGAPEYEFPFYYVQIANFREANDNPAGGDGWARVRMAQTKALSTPKTGMAVAIDIGEAKNVHPVNKEDVGKRLALWALARDYGRSGLVCSGPIYKGMQVQGNAIRVSFDHADKGLMIGRKEGHGPAVEAKADTATPDAKPELRRFAIAGADKKWFWADASIDGSTVLVASTNVPAPVAVRYAFSMNPSGCNLYNKDGLPASPFRTDEW